MHKKKGGGIKGRVRGEQRGNRKQTGHVWIQTASHNIADDGGDAEEPRGTNEKAPKRCKNSLSAQKSQPRTKKKKKKKKKSEKSVLPFNHKLHFSESAETCSS